MSERDANITVTNGCVQVQTRQRRSSGETAIHLHQRILAQIRPHVTLSAHNPKVAGSNPAPPPKKALVRTTTRTGAFVILGSEEPFVNGFVNEIPRACQRSSPTSSSIQQ